jgi:uncharacterized membrane protein
MLHGIILGLLAWVGANVLVVGLLAVWALARAVQRLDADGERRCDAGD